MRRRKTKNRERRRRRKKKMKRKTEEKKKKKRNKKQRKKRGEEKNEKQRKKKIRIARYYDSCDSNRIHKSSKKRTVLHGFQYYIDSYRKTLRFNMNRAIRGMNRTILTTLIFILECNAL